MKGTKLFQASEQGNVVRRDMLRRVCDDGFFPSLRVFYPCEVLNLFASLSL
jgi:hypothetical protein